MKVPWIAPVKKGTKIAFPRGTLSFYLPEYYNILVMKSQVKFELAC